MIALVSPKNDGGLREVQRVHFGCMTTAQASSYETGFAWPRIFCFSDWSGAAFARPIWSPRVFTAFSSCSPRFLASCNLRFSSDAATTPRCPKSTEYSENGLRVPSAQTARAGRVGAPSRRARAGNARFLGARRERAVDSNTHS